MRKTITMLAAAAALTLAGGSGAAAQELINKDGMTGPEVARWLQAAGYKAELTKDKGGDPKILSAAGGVNFTVYFYDCVKERCKALQFSAGFNLNDGLALTKINEWNKTHRYLKAWLDDENDPFVEYDVNVNAGRTMAGLNDDFDVWVDFLDSFTTFIGW